MADYEVHDSGSIVSPGWRGPDRDLLKKIAGAASVSAALLLVITVLLVVGLIAASKAQDEIVKQLHEIDQAVAAIPGNAATAPPDKK